MWPGAGMMSWGGYGGYGMSVFGGLFMLLFWGLIVLGILFVVRRLWDKGQSGAGAGRGDAPLEVLKRRYARGEIGKEEYERIKRDLA